MTISMNFSSVARFGSGSQSRIRGIEIAATFCHRGPTTQRVMFFLPKSEVTRSLSCQTVARFASNKGKQQMKATAGRTSFVDHHLNHNLQMYAGTWEMLRSGSDDDSDDLSIRTDSATVKMSNARTEMERRNEQMLGRGRHGEPLQADVAAGGGMEENHVMNEFQTATAVRRFIDSVSASLDRSDLIVQLILGFRGFLDRPLANRTQERFRSFFPRAITDEEIRRLDPQLFNVLLWQPRWVFRALEELDREVEEEQADAAEDVGLEELNCQVQGQQADAAEGLEQEQEVREENEMQDANDGPSVLLQNGMRAANNNHARPQAVARGEGGYLADVSSSESSSDNDDER